MVDGSGNVSSQSTGVGEVNRYVSLCVKHELPVV
jgi:hypothetical protein